MASKPSLLITTSTFPVHDGDGVPRFVLDLATALTTHFAVTVLAPHSSGASRSELIGNVSVRRFRYFWPARLQRLAEGGVVAVNLGGVIARLQIPFLLAAEALATCRLLRETKAVAVNPHWLIPQGMTAAVARLFLGTPLVLHLHAGDVYVLRRLRFGRAIARFVTRRSEAILADGSHVRSSIDELVGWSTGARLRPMGVWTETFRRTPGAMTADHPYVLFVGRFVEKKGVTYLLQAMVEVRRQLGDIRLVLVGTGPLETTLRKEAADLGLFSAVTFTGPLPHSEIIKHLHGCRVACVPSIVDSRGETEGMPTVVVEAMAAGARVVGTDVDGIPDILKDARNGWLAKPADSQDLTRQIVAAMQDSSADSRARRAVASARDHDWGEVARQYASVINEVAGARRD